MAVAVAPLPPVAGPEPPSGTGGAAGLASLSAGLQEPLHALPSQPSVSRMRPSDRALELFGDYADGDGNLPLPQLPGLLGALDIDDSPGNYNEAVQSVAGPEATVLTREQT